MDKPREHRVIRVEGDAALADTLDSESQDGWEFEQLVPMGGNVVIGAAGGEATAAPIDNGSWLVLMSRELPPSIPVEKT